MKKIAAIVIIALTLGACKNKTPEYKEQSVALLAPPPAVKADAEPNEYLKNMAVAEKAGTVDKVMYAPPALKQSSVDTSKKITKEGEIRFQTNNVNATRKSIIVSAQVLGGYIEQDTQTKNESSDTKEYNLKVRVPSKNFDKLLDNASGSADKIDSRNINIKDVSAEYIDTKARIDNKKRLEQRYLQLLSKATKMSDMLQIEEKLEDIRSDVESTQGQLNFMTKQVAYSTLDITFYSVSSVVNSNGLSYRLKVAVLGGWDLLQSLVLGIIACWPGIIILLLGFIWFKKRTKNRNIVAESA